jgi:hypothetical protein
MNVSRTSRGRSLLPLLTLSLSLASFPTSARADVFVSHLTDRTNTSENDALRGRATPRVVFRSRRFEEATEEEIEHGERSSIATLPVLAVILVLPPGLTPMSSVATQPLVPPAPVHVADSGNPSPASGGGQESGGGGSNPQTSPEPASLLLALTGSGATAFMILVRRRRNGRE